MRTPPAKLATVKNASEIARVLVEARQDARALTHFPGQIPLDLTEAYAVQDAAIALWPDEIVGWKIGRAPPHQRLTGPIFRKALRRATDDRPVPFPVFPGGFAAVEAEFVFQLAGDAPSAKAQWSTDEARALVKGLHIGVETAGSPMAAINDMGPTVVIADFGNNAGLIVGPAIADWSGRAAGGLKCETSIDGISVGSGVSAQNDLLDTLRFLLELSASRGLMLRAGTYVSTGAVTGIHDIRVGQSACVDFGSDGKIMCIAEMAHASR